MKPKLTTEELVAYIAGVADEKTTALIQARPELQRKAKRLAHAQAQFAAKLAGNTCPSTMQLGEYHLKTLALGTMQKIRSHLRNCPECMEKLNETARYLGVAFPVEPVFSLPYIYYPVSAQGGMEIGVRGESVSSVLHYRIEGGEISLEIQNDELNPGKKSLWGLLMVEQEQPAFASIQLTPLDPSQPTVFGAINSFGGFILTNLNPGDYELQLQNPEQTIVLREITL